MGVQKKTNQKLIVDAYECASHVTLFSISSIEALSLDLAGERRFATLAALAVICFKTYLSHIHVHIYIQDIGLSQ